MWTDNFARIYIVTMIIIVGVIVYIYFQIKYPIKVKGECLEANWGRWGNCKYRYVIEGVEYIGIGPSGIYPVKVGKYYTIWVNKDDHEKYTMTSMKTCIIWLGIILL